MRHGETKYQASGSHILYTKKDQFSLPITKRAKEFTKKQAQKLKKENIDLIYSSDYYRAKQTAGIIAKELGLKIIFDKRLRDNDFGIFSGQSSLKHKEYFSSKKQRFSKRPSGGESWRDVKKRAVDFLKEVDRKHKNKTILIIGHADPIWLLASHIKRLTEKQALAKRNPQNIWPDVGQIVKL